MKTVIALYDDILEAQKATQELLEAGFPYEKINIISSDYRGEFDEYLSKEEVREMYAEGRHGEVEGDTASDAAAGAGIGAVIGGLAGLLVGLGTLTLPAIGPVLIAGPIISTLAGAGVGTLAGGLVGVLADSGVPEERAGDYAEGVRRGGTLVIAETRDELASRAAEIMNHYGPVDIERRSRRWQEGGWTKFAESGGPLTPGEIDRERKMLDRGDRPEEHRPGDLEP